MPARSLALGAAVLLALAFPWLPVPEFWVTQANYVGIGALVGIGLVLLTGIGGMTSFGQAAFVGIGAYATAYLTTRLGWSPWLTLPAGLLLTAAAAVAIGQVTLRMSGHYLPLATIAWSIALYYLFGSVAALGRYDGLSGLPALALPGLALTDSRAMYLLVWLAVLLCAWGLRNLLDSRPGRACRAVRGGRQMPESVGVDTARTKIMMFVLAALSASLAGWLYAHMQRAVNPTPFGLNASLESVIIVVVGGMAHIGGAILGSGVVKLLQDQLQTLMPALAGAAGHYEIIVFGLIMLLLLRVAPQGLWPAIDRLLPARPRAPLPAAPELPRRPRPAAGELLLDVRGIGKHFGGLVAVDGVDFRVRAGEIVGLIGPNGAGKSTTFNLVTGVLRATSGEVRLRGEPVEALGIRAIAGRGVARTFQHVRLLPGMSVLDNVALGAHGRTRVHPLRAMLRADRGAEAQILQEAHRALARVGLAALAHAEAGSLALGQQRLVEIARALCADPDLLLLDEPAAGLRAMEKQALAGLLAQLRDEGLGLLLVEHDMDFVMRLTDHIVVMVYGRKIAEGRPQEIRQHPAVLEAYLGGVDE